MARINLSLIALGVILIVLVVFCNYLYSVREGFYDSNVSDSSGLTASLCSALTNCSSCADQDGCKWCGDQGKCISQADKSTCTTVSNFPSDCKKVNADINKNNGTGSTGTGSTGGTGRNESTEDTEDTEDGGIGSTGSTGTGSTGTGSTGTGSTGTGSTGRCRNDSPSHFPNVPNILPQWLVNTDNSTSCSSPAVNQGIEYKQVYPSNVCPPLPDMSQYVRKDSIPCWNCTLP